MKPSISAIIIAKNEEAMIANCIDTLQWCDEVIVVDSGSSDATAQLAENAGARVISFSGEAFDKVRNEGLKRAKTDWVFFIDADERVTPTLAKEIQVQLETSDASALQMKRDNIHYGRLMTGGGFDKDYVTRVFRREHLSGYQGIIHESPVYEGDTIQLHTALLHFTHRSTIEGLVKTISWTPKEAVLLYKANTKPVTVATLLRKGSMELLRRLLLKKGYQDGMPGVVESIVQAINRVLVYIQVWELQQKPSLADQYHKYELQIAQQWKKEKA